MNRGPIRVFSRHFIPFFMVILGVTNATFSQEPAAPVPKSVGPGAFRRPSGDPYQNRSVTIATHGMVATSHPLASLAGLDVLREGGNAADAAVAANAVLGVVEPMSCGIGGDLFALYWDAKSGKLYGLNASGRSPKGLTREVFAEKRLHEIPLYGPLSWSVPGCVSGWDELRKRFGTRGWDRLMAPAVDYAENGFPVSEVIAGYWKGSEKRLLAWPNSAETLLVEGRAPRGGEVFKNARLAASLRAISQNGAEAFYRGEIAEHIVAFSQQHGGYFSQEDFAGHNANWIEPVSTSYRGYDVWELPPNGQGIAVLQILNLLEPYDLRAWGPGSPDYLHLFLEAKKLAYADRSRHYADPAFGPLPVETLISKEYAQKRGAEIDMSRAKTESIPIDPRLAMGDTIYLAVVDKDRNCCSLIQSNFHGFGSCVVPGEVGFAIQNRGALFSLRDDHPNRLEPGKRPFHTIIPAMVTRHGKPWLSFGVMGGDMQPQGHVQVLVNMIDFGMNVQAAGDAARVRHDGSPTPTSQPAIFHGGKVAVEPGITPEVRDELVRRGHTLHEESGGGFGGYQAILIDWEHGTLHGASEPRKDGIALGY